MNAISTLRAATLAALLLQGIAATRAATLYWDADGDASDNNVDGTGLGSVGLGTTGTWHTASAWWDGVSATNQNWVASSDAVFAGTKGRVQLAADVTAASLQFNVAGYLIDVCPTAGANIGGYNLTANGIGGEIAELLNSSVFTTAANRTFTLNIASGTTSWNGKIYSGRLGFTKGGAGTLTSTNRIGVVSTWGQPGFNVNGGRLNLIGNAGCNSDGCNFGVGNGAILDAGDNAFSARNWTVSYGGTLTTTGGGASITHNSSFDRGAAWGVLSGPLMVRFAHNGASGSIHILAATNNTYTGGTLLNSATAGTCDVRVQADSASGTGRVRLENSAAGNTSKLGFQSAAPTLGSLESANAGVKQVVLGTTGATLASATFKARWTSGTNTVTVRVAPWGVTTYNLAVGQAVAAAAGNGIPVGSVITEVLDATTFRISQNATVTKSSDTAMDLASVSTTLTVGSLSQSADTFGGAIGQASGTIGSVTKVGTGVWTLSGANTYTGATRVVNGTLRVTHATAGLAACKVQVAGGTFAGPASSGTGVVKFNLGATPDSGIVMTSGALDLSRVGLDFVGTATEDSYTLVDYSAGGTFTGATNLDTANSFASAANVPDGYKFAHDTTAKTVTLFLPPAGTVLLLR